jgi:hypothetical protein
LRKLHDHAGGPSLPDLATAAARLGIRMPTSTASNLLAGKGSPRVKTVLAFVRCCAEYARRNGTAADHEDVFNLDLWAAKYQRTYPQRRSAGPRPDITEELRIRFGQLPGRAACYQARPEQAELERTLTAKRTAVLQDAAKPATDLLTGMGGVGKTQIALAYFSKVCDDPEWTVAAWIPAGSQKDVVDGYARLAARILGSDVGEPKRAARDLLEWLQNTPETWLVVLDGLDDPEDLAGWWPPTTPTGHTVITTRRRSASLWGANRTLIPVERFTREQSIRYLRQRLDGKPALLDDAELLADSLEDLPLALAQAAAFMWDYDLTARTYCARFSDARRTLPDLFPPRGAGPDEYQETVATTWAISIDAANRERPAGVARPVLSIASLLSPNGIPADIFRASAVVEYLRATVRHAVGTDDVRDGLRVLHRLHLVTADIESDGLVYVHGLVQRAARESIARDALPALGRVVADALDHAAPDIDAYVDLELVHALRSNTDALAEHAGIELITADTGPHAVLTTIGHSLGRAGMPNEARAYFQKLIEKVAEIRGEDDLETLKVRGHAASWLGHSHQWPTALDEFDTLYRHFRRVVGDDHPETIKARASRASYLARTGSVAKAIDEFEIILELRTRLLGAFHPDTLTTRARLARWRGETGQIADAIHALEQLLKDYRKHYEDDLRSIFLSRANLARWRGIAGDPAAAAAEYQALLQDRLATYRSDHPDTITTRKSLIHWYRKANNRQAAEAAQKELVAEERKILAKQEALYSPNHPDALARRLSLTKSQTRNGGPKYE